MSKNLTRKGLAFGALVALGSTLIAGAPAHAAGSITLNPSTGTAWNTLTSSKFSVSPVITGVNADEYKYLRYLVTNPDELDLRVDIEQVATGDGESTFEAGTATAATRKSIAITDWAAGEVASTTNDTITFTVGAGHGIISGDIIKVSGFVGTDDGTATTIADTAETAVNGNTFAATVSGNNITLTSTNSAFDTANTAGVAASAATATAGTITVNELVKDDSFVVAPDDTGSGSNVNVIGTANHLIIDPLDITKATSVKVKAWIDGNQNNIIDSGETVGDEKTIGFKKASTLSASVSVLNARLGSTAVTAAVTLTGDINYQQVTAGQVKVTIFQGSTARPSAGQNLSWDSVNSRWSYEATGLTIAAADVFTAKVYADNDLDNAGAADVSDADDLKVTSGDAKVGASLSYPTFELKAVAAKDVVTTQSAQNDTDAASANDAEGFATRNGTAYARTGTASLSISIYVGSNAVTPVGVADAEVQIAVGSTNVTNTDSITVGGKAVTGGVVTYNTTTGATGTVTIPVSLGSADDGDVLTFTATVGGTALNSSVLTLNVTDGTFSATQVTPGAQSIKAGEKIAIDYRVVDEFGVAPTNNTYSIVVTPTANERTTAATWSNTLQVVDGKASLSVTDNGVGDGKFVTSAQLYKGASSVGSALTTTVNVVADPVAKTVTAEKLAYGTSQAKDLNNDGDYADTDEVDNTAKLLVSTKTFSNYDSRYALPTDVAPTVTDVTKVTVGGKVTNAAGTGVAGALVTFAAKGFLFKSGTVYAQDSITVRADSTGIASVDVWSHVGGSQSIKMTSGAASAAQALVYAPAAAVAGKTIAFAPKGVSASGRAIDLTATISDVFGLVAKGVSVTFTATGVGYLSANSASTLSDGKATVKLITLAGETGAATVTAIFTDVDGVEVVTSKTIYVGVKASIVKAATSSAVVKNAAGATVKIVRGTKSKTVTATSSSQKISVKGGSGTVKVYVNGVKVASK